MSDASVFRKVIEEKLLAIIFNHVRAIDKDQAGSMVYKNDKVISINEEFTKE